MKHLFIIVILLVLSTPAHATRQIPDEIKYEGQRYFLSEFPLDEYIKDNNINMLAHIKKGMCSANWRSYVAHWVVENGKLYLSEMYSDACGEPEPLSLDIVFPDAKDRIKADWFTGILKLHESGELYMGKDPRVQLEFVKGAIIGGE